MTQKSFAFDLALLINRLVAGLFLLSLHGVGKILNYQEMATQFPDPLGLGSGLSLMLAIFAEALCAGLVALGLFTRLACVPIIFLFLVLIFHVHLGDGWGKREYLCLYALPFVTVLLLGGGRFALERVIKPFRK